MEQQRGHPIVVNPEDEALFAGIRRDPDHHDGGRHPEIAEAQGHGSDALTSQLMHLSEDMLASIGVGAGQRIVADMMPPGLTVPAPRHGLEAFDRTAHVSRLRDSWSDANFKVRRFTANITQLIAVEHVLWERLLVMEEDLNRHESEPDPQCCGCGLTVEALAQKRAKREQAMEGKAPGEGAPQRSMFGKRK
jgi:hypothetical protein